MLQGPADPRPVAASHSRAVLSQAPGEDRLAVRAERHGHHRARMLQGLADGPAGGGVPEPRRLVLAPGEDRLAVGAEGDRAIDRAPWEKTPFSSTSWRRQADRLARATCCQASSPASAAIRSDSTVQSIPSPICPFSKAAWPRSKFSIASRRFDSDSAVLRSAARPSAPLSFSRSLASRAIRWFASACRRRRAGTCTATATSAAAATPIDAASPGFRRHHRASRSAAETRRARIGRSSRNRRRSSARARGRRVPVRRVAGDRLGDDRLQVARDARRQLLQPRRLLVQHLVDQRVPVRRLERRPQRQQLVQRQAQAVDVATARRTGPGTAPGPCSGSCPRCRRCGSGRRPRPSWPGRSR